MARVAGTHGATEPMPTGLQRRGARYYLRRRVPEPLVAAFGRKEIIQALGTSDFKDAKKLLVLAWAELDRQFEAAGPIPAPGLAQALEPERKISPTVIALTDLDNLRARQLDAEKAGKLAGFRQECRDALTLYQEMLEGVRPPDDDLRVIEGRRNGIRAFLTGEGAMSLSAARRVLVPHSTAENQLRALTTTTWDGLLGRWSSERRPNAKTKAAHASVARQLVDALGDFPVEQLTKQHALRFKDWLVERGTTPANLKTKLSRIKTLVNYGYDNDLIGVRAFDGIRIKQSRERARRSFDEASLAKLFSGPVHKLGERPLQGRGEASFWMPLIALFTGARMEEIAHLTTDDVLTISYADANGDAVQSEFFRFVNDPESLRELKTKESERLAPVHSELLRLGLLRYRDSVVRAGESQLFPALTQHRDGKRAHKWGQWFSGYLRKECGVSDPKVVFHSFRHTFKDNCRNSGIAEELQRGMMGHTARDVADRYGEGFARFRAVEAMKSYKAFGMPSI